MRSCNIILFYYAFPRYAMLEWNLCWAKGIAADNFAPEAIAMNFENQCIKLMSSTLSTFYTRALSALPCPIQTQLMPQIWHDGASTLPQPCGHDVTRKSAHAPSWRRVARDHVTSRRFRFDWDFVDILFLHHFPSLMVFVMTFIFYPEQTSFDALFLSTKKFLETVDIC